MGKTKAEIIAEYKKEFGRAGAEARAKALTPQRRKAIARQGGTARAKALSAKRRSEIARKAGSTPKRPRKG